MLSQESGYCFDRREEEEEKKVSVDFKNTYDSDLSTKPMGKLQANGGEMQNT